MVADYLSTRIVSPPTAKVLLEAGYVLHMERSPASVYDDEEFEAVGALMVPEGSWVEAPKDYIITGLKELPDDGSECLIPTNFCDVSLDPNNPNNPVPVCSTYTNFTKPTVKVPVSGDGPHLTVVSVDHLPTLIAREASGEFSRWLLPSLLTLNSRENEGVWTRAENLYREKVKEL
ncbi:saccharopine dehydrogenase protein [Fusarium austroafricanum]|uniref:Saccharopine dehydrogenase protein n=1 Tax=Fusarium austroafricanum TaxID=2364996 RepID=A0A8H4NS86_9HYPO|nr:saccharopine dehydrogenase protein [Fusarium austroafricanum]